MKIYQHEINDGLSDAIEGGNVIAFQCDLKHSLIEQEFAKKVLAGIGENLGFASCTQEDLYYLNSVLVSAGWNKNDDVFSSSELWNARHTPVNKQFNMMHDETDIIGHIIKSVVVDENGSVVPEETEESELPAKIDIITNAVMYKTWSDPLLKARVQDLIEEIEEGKWAVSMECVFKGFDYAVVDPTGRQTVVERNENTAFLTKHLRAYGGSGSYEGYKVGRMLKAFFFSGKGLVDNPANPRSIILSKDVDPFDSTVNVNVTNFLTAMEKDMSKDIDLQAELDAAKAQVESVREELKKEKDEAVASVQAKLTESEASVASLKEEVSSLTETVASLTKEKESLEASNNDLKESLVAATNDLTISRRKAQLIQAGASEEKITELLTTFANADDEMFNSVVALIVPEKPAEEKEEEVEAEVSEEEEEDVTASDLDDVEEVEDPALASADDNSDEEQAIASTCEWIKNSVLNSTKNKK